MSTGQQNERQVDYELALRALGRHLDAEPAYSVRIVEVDDGFTVEYRQTQHISDRKIEHFPFDRLTDLHIFQTAGRGEGVRKQRYSGFWARLGESHQEFFRALGHRLNQERASWVSLEKSETDVSVEYQRPHPTEEQLTEQCQIVLDERAIVDMVAAARGLRKNKLHIVRD